MDIQKKKAAMAKRMRSDEHFRSALKSLGRDSKGGSNPARYIESKSPKLLRMISRHEKGEKVSPVKY